MNARRRLAGLAILAIALTAGFAIGLYLSQPGAGVAQQPESAAQRYSVVHTEGTNLIVTDNKINTLYFYTVDQGAEPGSNLRLRGSLDLSQVGKDVLIPKLFKKPQ
jgi:hypothetical protein